MNCKTLLRFIHNCYIFTCAYRKEGLKSIFCERFPVSIKEPAWHIDAEKHASTQKTH